MMVTTPTDLETIAVRLPLSMALQVTAEQFAALAVANGDLQLERTATGALVVNPPAGGESGRRNFSITAQLGRWVEENLALGEGFDASTGFVLPNGAIRSPDAAWVRRDRWEGLSLEQRRGFVPLCPDFVVELRSESDRLAVLQAKMREYLENGAGLGWLIDPQSQRVEVYRAGGAVEGLVRPGELLGEGVLPGFVLRLGRVW